MAENKRLKTEISEEEFKKRVAAKRKELYKKRAIFIAVCLLVLALAAALVFAIISVIKDIDGKRNDSGFESTSSTLQGIDRNLTERIHYAGDVIYLVTGGKLEARLGDGMLLWEKEIPGEGDVMCTVSGGNVIWYRIGGNTLSIGNKTGETLVTSVEGEIDFAAVNMKNEKGVICYKKGADKATVRAFAFDEKSMKQAEPDAVDKTAVLFEKSFTSDYVISASVSADGKSVAIGELSENGSTASTKLSLVSVDTGKTFFTKVFDNEICPFLQFSADNVLVIAGNRSVYTLTTDRGASSGTKVKQICEYAGENNEVVSVAVITGRLAVISGNSAGDTDLTVYDLKNGAIRGENDGLMPRGVLPCGDCFAIYTDGVVRIIGKECEILGSSETFEGIRAVYGSDSLAMTVEDSAGYAALWFEK